MTPRERAEAIIKEWEGVTPTDWDWYQHENMCIDIEQTIIEAVTEEREACAKILDGWAEVNKKHDRIYESEILKTGAVAIRARSNS